jgi:hypothetical protein
MRRLVGLLVFPALLGAAPEGFVRASPRDRRYLELTTGAPYIPNGPNLIAPPREGFEVYEQWLTNLAANGGNCLSWTEVMLAGMRRRFPRNLVMQSLGSFDTARVRETYCRHSTMPAKDLAQVYCYLDLGAPLEVCKGPMDVLAAGAVHEFAD